MYTTKGYLVVAHFINYNSPILYGENAESGNEPCDQFRLNGFVGIQKLRDTRSVAAYLEEVHDNLIGLEMIRYCMHVTESFSEVDELPDHAGSVFVTYRDKSEYDHREIFGPMTKHYSIQQPHAPMFGMDNYRTLVTNGFQPFPPVTTTPGNECFMSAANWSRQCQQQAFIATWEHNFINPYTGRKI